MPLESCKVALACINCNSFPSFISGWQNIITFFNYKHGFLQMATKQVKYSFYTLRSSVEPHQKYNETKEYIRKSSRTQPRKTSASPPTWKKTLHSHHKDNTSTTHQQHNHDTSTTHQHIQTTVTSSTTTHPLHINNTTASHDQHNCRSTTQQPPSQLSTTLITTLTTAWQPPQHNTKTITQHKDNTATTLYTNTHNHTASTSTTETHHH